MRDLSYPRAVGLLQARCVSAAIDIESIVRNWPIDALAKQDLLRTAKSLRDADHAAEAMTEPVSQSDFQKQAHQGDR